MNIIKQYAGFPKEMYVLFLGRIANTMGQVVWATMTLILSNKLNYSASSIAVLQLVMLLLQLPFIYVGGKLADRINKKMIIAVCDFIVALCFIICGFLPVSLFSVWVFYAAGTFAMVEQASYDALVADLSLPQDRERAYSLSYLGMNLGYVITPALSGMLFEEHLALFYFICGTCILSSSIMIFLGVKRLRIEGSSNISEYERSEEKASSMTVLINNRVIFYFICLYAISQFIYNDFFFLVPLHLEALFGALGATYYGYLSSLNAIVVLTMTTFVVKLFMKRNNFTKIVTGEALIVLGLSLFIFIENAIWLCVISVIIFTLGEILTTVSKQPFIIARIPATHRGRIFAIMNVAATVLRAFLQVPFGSLADIWPMPMVWLSVSLLGIVSIILYLILIRKDKRDFSALWSKKL